MIISLLGGFLSGGFCPRGAFVRVAFVRGLLSGWGEGLLSSSHHT